MFKRLVAVASATALTIAMSVSAFAAVTPAQKSAILDTLKNEGLSTSDPIYAQVSSVLDDTSITLTDAQVSTIQSQAKVVREEIRKINAENPGTIKDFESLKKAVANNAALASTVTSAIETAGKAAGLTDIKIDLKSGKAVTFKAPSGKTYEVSTTGNSAAIENTGVDFSTTAAVVAGLGLSVAGIAVIAKKKDLVNA